MIRRLFQLFKYVQALSLDVAFGSTVMSFFIAKILKVEVSFSIYFALFIAVWLIYTIDHLIDVSKLQSEAYSFRHRFHKKYFKNLTLLWIFVFLFGVLFSFTLPLETRKVGFIASALVIVHLVLVYLLGSKISILVQKELGVAFTYCLGIAVGPVSVGADLSGYGYFVLIQIFILALVNLLEFSWFDRNIDKQQKQSSAVGSLGSQIVLESIFFLFGVFAIFNIIGFMVFPEFANYQIILCTMGIGLFAIITFNRYFSRNERYRVLGDAVFLFPLLVFLQ